MPVPKRNLRHSTIDHIDHPIPPEPDPPQESSPLETNPFNALDDPDSGTDDMNDPDNTLPLSSLSVPCPPILPPPSNLELSHKLDNLILLMSTSQRNYETMKNEVDQLKQTHAPSSSTTHHPNVTNLLSVINGPLSITASHIQPPTIESDVKPPKPTPPMNVKSNVNIPNVSASVPQSSETTDTSPGNQFGQNEFSVAVTNNTKMKFSTMESSLKDCILLSDSQRDMKTLYEGITKSITFLLNQELDLLPDFNDLHRKIDFKSLFLSNLLGATLAKCKPIVNRFGTLIRARLLSKDCIDPTKCPKAALKVLTHSLMDGWTLFETILKTRLVICGAQADFDLDRVRTNLTFLPNESFTEFYIRTQHIINEYDMNTRGARVPITKITDTFINELSRAPVYVPYLARYQTEMVDHVLVFGDSNYDYLPPISPSEIHEILIKVKAPPTPPSLLPSCDITSSPPLCMPTSTPSLKSSSSQTSEVVDVTYPKDLSAVISILQQTTDPDCTNPVLCFQSQQRSRCKACLVGFHEEVDCYARGPSFLPPKLRRRIMVYNQTHGDKPPPDHKFRDYNPKGVTPDHGESKNPSRSSVRFKKDVRPFSNYHTKSKQETASIRSFQLIDNVLVADPIDDGNDAVNPTINSFIQSQTSFVDKIIEEDKLIDDTSEPIICSMMSGDPPPSVRRAPYTPSSIPYSFARFDHPTLSASQNTPPEIQQIIQKAHNGITTLPSKQFIRQFSKNLSTLDTSVFTSFCRMESHCDQGANVGSVVDKRYFLFFIPTATSVQQVGGDMIQSPGWGGVLYRFNGSIYLQAPTYLCPNSPQNTFSPGCFKNYSNFKKVLVDTNENVTLIDDTDTSSVIPFSVNNGLDYVNLEVMCFRQTQQHPTIAAIPGQLRRSPRLHTQIHESVIPSPPLIDTSTGDSVPTLPSEPSQTKRPCLQMPVLPFPRNVMEKIATYFVLLHPTDSPRVESI